MTAWNQSNINDKNSTCSATSGFVCLTGPVGFGRLVAAIGELESEPASQHEHMALSREENAELRRQLRRHGRNSSQPPSQEGPSASVFPDQDLPGQTVLGARRAGRTGSRTGP